MTDYIGAGPSSAVDTGYMTGRKLTIGGVRVGTTNFNGKLKEGSLAITVQPFFTETDRNGKKRILSGLPFVAGWNDRIAPAPNRDGFVAAKGATQPGPDMRSEWVAWAKAAVAAGIPEKLLGGSLRKLVGAEVILTTIPAPERKARKSVDPDEKPREPRTIEVIGELVTLPSENKEYKGLSDKEIDAFLAERTEKSAARRAARSEEDESPAKGGEEEEAEAEENAEAEEESAEDETEEVTEETEKAEEEEAEEEASDDDDEAPAPKVQAPSAEATKAATAAIKKVLTGKKMDASLLLQKVHPYIVNLDKKVRAEVLKLVQSAGFLQKLGVKINGNKVSLAA